MVSCIEIILHYYTYCIIVLKYVYLMYAQTIYKQTYFFKIKLGDYNFVKYTTMLL